MNNTLLIENTVENTIELANIGKLAKSKIRAYIHRDDTDSDRIYKIDPFKHIRFNTFGIANYMGKQLPIYFDNKYSKMRCAICIVTIQTLLQLCVADNESNDEYFRCAVKWLANHKKLTAKIVGQVDLSEMADIILQPCKLYDKIYNR